MPEFYKIIRQIWHQFWVILDHWGDIGGLMCVQRGPRGRRGWGGEGLTVPLYSIVSRLEVSYHIRLDFKCQIHQISNCLGWPTWFRFYAIGPSKDPKNDIGRANEAVLGQQEFRKYQYVGSIMPYIRGNHPDGTFSDIWDQIFWLLALWWYFSGSKTCSRTQKGQNLVKIYHIGGP